MHHQVKVLVATRLIDVNQIDKSTGRTPLSLAAAVGSTSCIQILLSAGARPGLRDEDGSIMLHSACKWGHGAVVYYTSEFLKFAQFRAFQAASATPDGAAAGGQGGGGGFVDLICMQDKYGWVLLKVAARHIYHVYIWVCDEVWCGVARYVDREVARGRYSPVHKAAYNNRHHVVCLVLRLARENQPADPAGAVRKALSLQTLNGNTALHLAARLGHVEVVYALLVELDKLDVSEAAEILLKKNHDNHSGLIHKLSAEEVAESHGHQDAAEQLRAKRLLYLGTNPKP